MSSLKRDISKRADVFLLVYTFYEKVRAETTLGPIFNDRIKDWDAHLELLTTFWETSLFFTKKLDKKYKGNPLKAHVKVDKSIDNTITELHFGLWLNLWIETIDELFSGDYANIAKRRARKMASFLYLKIFDERTKS